MKRLIAASLIAFMTQTGFAAEKVAHPLTDKGSWNELREDIIGDTNVIDGSKLFKVTAPYRAHDAATVPIVIHQTDNSSPIKSLKMVIDENPSPLVADITFGKAMSPLKFEVRVRVNQYSNVRVLATTENGTYMQGKYVKASGGCSAPATKDATVALANMGKMRLKHIGDQPKLSNQRREAQIMIRHPNYSGLSRDQITQLFVGAHFIDEMQVYQGDELLFKLESGISISENPVFRFDYTDNGSTTIRVRAVDTEGNVFEKTMEKDAQS